VPAVVTAAGPESAADVAVTALAGAAAVIEQTGSAYAHFLDPTNWVTVAALGFFLMGVMHWPWLRGHMLGLATDLGAALYFLVLDLPRRLVRRETLEAMARSWPFQVFYWCLFGPLLICVLLGFAAPQIFFDIPEVKDDHAHFAWMRSVIVFLSAGLVARSTMGRATGEAIVQGGVRLYELFRSGLLTGLYNFILYAFKQLVDGLEYVLYSVDEYLRYRSGDSRFLLIVRTVLSALWFPVSYLIRFYSVVLIEPMINPIKLPLTILAAKIVYPLLAAQGWIELKGFTSPLVDRLSPYVGGPLAWILVIPTLWFLPDAFVFLFWEMQENWRLYRANRPGTLRPAVIGGHGETMRMLLEVGFHSGTVPRLYARLRRAERQAARTGNWQTARYYRGQLNDVEEAMRLFVTRNLVALVRQSAAWRDRGLEVGGVDPACSRIGVELVHDAYPDRPVWLEFELHAGWLLAGIAQRGWLDDLPWSQLRPLNTGLASLYKLAGIDLVREQVRAALPPYAREYDVTGRDLLAWKERRLGPGVAYDLTARADLLTPRLEDGSLAKDWPPLDPARLIYARVPLTRQQWIECWQKDQETGEHPPLILAGKELTLIPGLAPNAAPDTRTDIVLPSAVREVDPGNRLRELPGDPVPADRLDPSRPGP
jgi:hypothetical protein